MVELSEPESSFLERFPQHGTLGRFAIGQARYGFKQLVRPVVAKTGARNCRTSTASLRDESKARQATPRP